MVDHHESDNHQAGMQEAQINRALGVFLLAFALIVLFSILFTSTTIGKLTNLGAGGIIGLIGGAMAYRAHTATKKRED